MGNVSFRREKGGVFACFVFIWEKNLVETKLSILLASASGKTCRHYSILINAIANILLYWFSEFYSSEEGR